MMPPFIAAFFAKWGLALAALVIALAATFYAGKLHERSAWNARATVAVEAARSTERDGSAIAHRAETDSLTAANKQLEKAHAELETLRAKLYLVRDCRVPRDVVRLLDGVAGVPATARAAAQPGPAAARVEADTGDATAADAIECRAVIENCAVNRLTVCEPNAAQLDGMQRFYHDLRHRFNQP